MANLLCWVFAGICNISKQVSDISSRPLKLTSAANLNTQIVHRYKKYFLVSRYGQHGPLIFHRLLTVTLTTVIMSLITLTQDTQVRAVHKSRTILFLLSLNVQTLRFLSLSGHIESLMTNPSRLSALKCWLLLLKSAHSWKLWSLSWQDRIVSLSLLCIVACVAASQASAQLSSSTQLVQWPGLVNMTTSGERRDVSQCQADTLSDICTKWRWLGIETWHLDRLMDSRVQSAWQDDRLALVGKHI